VFNYYNISKLSLSSTRNVCTNNNNLPGQQKHNIIRQNGKTSSSRRRRQLDISYFFVKDKI